MKNYITVLGIVLLSTSCRTNLLNTMKEEPNTKLVLASELKWEKLNPARGDKSPQATTIWGDRKGSKVPTGFLVKFVDGFRSPPHIHNVTYKGVVISGLIHNDDPSAENMWMPVGSFWTQPKGAVHITAAKGKTNIAFIEIESAPYLVMPSTKVFDSGERPINVDPSNIVWIDSENSNLIEGNSLEVAYLWGKPNSNQKNGTFIKLASGMKAKLSSLGKSFKLIVISGKASLNNSMKTLLSGSYFGLKGQSKYRISCKSKSDCLFYINSEGSYKFEE